MKRLAILASGSGTNAEKIMDYFRDHSDAEVSLVVSNKPQAGVLKRAEKYGVDTLIVDRPGLYEREDLLQALQARDIDWIVLAGFLWLIPPYLVDAFPNRIINIHPALLPKYGGKGMYGMHVHRAIVAAGERETGITIHYVNPRYDEGAIIFQATCEIGPDDTPEDVARKVQALEHRHFAPVIEKLIT